MSNKEDIWRTRAIEDFLRVIYELQEGDAPVSTTQIAKGLTIAPSSDVSMIDRLSASDTPNIREKSPLFQHLCFDMSVIMVSG